MTSIFESTTERLLAKAELAYESERVKVERMLAECGKTKVQPAKDYWHKLDNLRRKVNLLRDIANGRVESQS